MLAIRRNVGASRPPVTMGQRNTVNNYTIPWLDLARSQKDHLKGDKALQLSLERKKLKTFSRGLSLEGEPVTLDAIVARANGYVLGEKQGPVRSRPLFYDVRGRNGESKFTLADIDYVKSFLIAGQKKLAGLGVKTEISRASDTIAGIDLSDYLLDNLHLVPLSHSGKVSVPDIRNTPSYGPWTQQIFNYSGDFISVIESVASRELADWQAAATFDFPVQLRENVRRMIIQDGKPWTSMLREYARMNPDASHVETQLVAKRVPTRYRDSYQKDVALYALCLEIPHSDGKTVTSRPLAFAAERAGRVATHSMNLGRAFRTHFNKIGPLVYLNSDTTLTISNQAEPYVRGINELPYAPQTKTRVPTGYDLKAMLSIKDMGGFDLLLKQGLSQRGRSRYTSSSDLYRDVCRSLGFDSPLRKRR